MKRGVIFMLVLVSFGVASCTHSRSRRNIEEISRGGRIFDAIETDYEDFQSRSFRRFARSAKDKSEEIDFDLENEAKQNENESGEATTPNPSEQEDSERSKVSPELELLKDLVCKSENQSNATSSAECILAKKIADNANSRKDKKSGNVQETGTPDIFKYIPKTYNKLEVPLLDGEYAVKAWFNVDILEVKDFDELEETVTLEIEISIGWLDGILEKHKGSPLSENGTQFVTLSPQFIKELWNPDLFFVQGLYVRQHRLLGQTAKFNLWYDGSVYYRTRMIIKLSCEMNFQYYPADTQQCDFTVRSFAYNINNLILSWGEDGNDEEWAVFLQETGDPNWDFQVLSYSKENIPLKLGPKEYTPLTNLQFTFLARRKMTYHLVQTYAASVFFVLVTWLCFLISADLFEVRVGIAMSTLLTLTAMFASTRETSPNVSYVKAIDVWMIACIVFIFAALAIFCLTAWTKRSLLRIHKMCTKQHGAKRSAEFDMSDSESEVNLDHLLNNKTEADLSAEELKRWRKYYIRITFFLEKICVWALSVGFIAFNIAYWTVLIRQAHYLQWAPNSTLNNVEEEGEGLDIEE